MIRLKHYVEFSKIIIIFDHEPLKGVLYSAPGTVYSTRFEKFRMRLMPFLDNRTILYIPGTTITNVDPLFGAGYYSERSGGQKRRRGGNSRRIKKLEKAFFLTPEHGVDALLS